MKRIILLSIAALIAAACAKIKTGDIVPPAVDVVFRCDNDEVTVSEFATSATFAVRSTVPWNVRLLRGEDWISSYTKSGVRDDIVELEFSDNSSSERERHAVLQIWSMQDESVTMDLKLTQESLKHLSASLSQNIAPKKGGDLTLEILSNVSWTVEAEGLQLSQEEGSGNANVTVTVPENTTYDKKTYIVKVIPSVSSINPVELSFVQNQAFAPVRLTFVPTDWDPVLTEQKNNLGFTGVYKHVPSGYSVEFCATTDPAASYYAYRGFSSMTISSKPSVRFNTNKAIAGWIILPCPNDRSIKTVYIFCPNSSSKKFDILDGVSETAVAGNKLAPTKSLTNAGCTFGSKNDPWLSAPGLGESVYILSSGNNAGLSEIVIEFE